MLFKLLAIAVVCAAAIYLYLKFSRSGQRPRLRARRARASRAATTGLEANPAPVRRGIVDLFLFEQSFGWELTRVLIAALPVVAALLALYWLARTAP
jgi:hypothetical protein